MRKIKIYWIKLAMASVLLVAVTAFCTAYITSGFLYGYKLKFAIERHGENEGEVGDSFKQAEPIFPEGLGPESPPNRQTTNEKNEVIMIRRPKGIDLDPKPVEWLRNVTPPQLGWTELPTSRPPHSILLGFGKCGTSALLEFLALHPRIVSLDWEPDYFCQRMYPKYDLQWYVKKMPPSFSNQVTIEKSPCYIVEHDSHLRMHAMNSSLKVMVIVRDPITRLLSEYGHYYATETYWGKPAMSFEERIFNQKTNEFKTGQILKVGDYSPHFEHLLKVFPRNQLLILDGDALVRDPLSQIQRVETFLGLPHQITDQDIYWDTEKGFYCMRLRAGGETKCMGKSKGRQHVQVDPDLQRKLVEFFRPYNEKLFNIVGERFDWLQ